MPCTPHQGLRWRFPQPWSYSQVARAKALCLGTTGTLRVVMTQFRGESSLQRNHVALETTRKNLRRTRVLKPSSYSDST